MFKWICLAVAIIALAGFGWMINDMRLEVKALAQRADRLAERADAIVTKTENHLPNILTQAEKATDQLDRHLPKILSSTEKATETLNTQLPTLLVHSEMAVDSISDLSYNFKQYKGLMTVVHAANQDKGLFSYGASILNFLSESDATIGVKKPGGGLKHAMPAKAFASAAKSDVQFLSLVSKSKEEMLNGLCRSNSMGELHIQVGSRDPRPLSAYLKETHSESKEIQ